MKTISYTKILITSLVFFIIIPLAKTAVARADSCDEDTISSISDQGDVLVMESGNVFQAVNAGDVSDWQEGDDVLVCDQDGDPVKLINKDEDGEEADAEFVNQ